HLRKRVRGSQTGGRDPAHPWGTIHDRSDESLMLAVARAVAADFAARVRRCHPALRGCLLRLAHEPYLADGLVQETFLRVYTRADTFHAERRFRRVQVLPGQPVSSQGQP